MAHGIDTWSEMTHSTRGYRPIGDYAIIGDAHTAALVATDGAIDWCCCPRFDSAAVFCRLLDADAGGYYRVGPVGPYGVSRAYVPWTNVLATTFETETGRIRLTDFMPARQRRASRRGEDIPPSHRILRLIEGLTGSVDCEVVFRPRFGFAAAPTVVQPCEGGAIAHQDGGNESLILSCPLPLYTDVAASMRGRWRIEAGDRVWLSMIYHVGAMLAPGEVEVQECDALLEETLRYWRDWSGACAYDGPYHELVRRSALVLKLLVYEPSGAIIAAPTTSLPEEIGGVRNWDYRYTWLRDAALVLHALQSIGYHEEAGDFFDWVEQLCIRCRGQLRIMYGVDGREDLEERDLPHLQGYRGSRPVRVGNAAARQTQLDVFGAVMDAAFVHFQAQERSLRPDMWTTLRYLADQAAARWHEPDYGIWEIRGDPQHFLHSKLLCWVALDRALRIADVERLPAETNRWRSARDDIRRTMLARGYNGRIGAFTQAFGSDVVDASALTIPLVDFLPASDSRVRSTMDVVRERLTSNGLVYRYHTEQTDDGLPGKDATFGLCTFWLIDNLALAGRVEEARTLFERITAYANDVGLLSEEIEPVSGDLLGNYPQGFTHLALIRSAVRIGRSERAAARTRGSRSSRTPA